MIKWIRDNEKQEWKGVFLLIIINQIKDSKNENRSIKRTINEQIELIATNVIISVIKLIVPGKFKLINIIMNNKQVII